MDMRKQWKPPSDAFRYATVGLEFIAIFGAFVAGGVWLDMRVGVMPLFTVLGMLIGFAGGMYRMVRVSREYRQANEKPPHDT